MRKIGLIVPCYNEAARFDADGFAALAALPDVSLVLVDDGSTDDTESCLRRLAGRAGVDAEVLSAPHNRGKAESVRVGMRHALASGAEIAGYLDADLATPPSEVARLLGALTGDVAGVLGSRVQLLGTHIERRPLRHYLGRVFGTFAALALGVPVYDTQCGAKVFRATPALAAALATPFASRWCFDVELLGRLLIGGPDAPALAPGALRELPLERWRDVPGSKLTLAAAPRLAWELLRVALDLAARRRRAGAQA